MKVIFTNSPCSYYIIIIITRYENAQKHYEHLGRVSIDSDFDSNWKELVERKVSMCGSLSKVCEDEALDIGK